MRKYRLTFLISATAFPRQKILFHPSVSHHCSHFINGIGRGFFMNDGMTIRTNRA